MKMLGFSKMDRKSKALEYIDMVKLRGSEKSFIHDCQVE